MWVVWCVLCRRNLCLIGGYVCLSCIDSKRVISPAQRCPACWGDGYVDHDLCREPCLKCVTSPDPTAGREADDA